MQVCFTSAVHILGALLCSELTRECSTKIYASVPIIFYASGLSCQQTNMASDSDRLRSALLPTFVGSVWTKLPFHQRMLGYDVYTNIFRRLVLTFKWLGSPGQLCVLSCLERLSALRLCSTWFFNRLRASCSGRKR